MICWSQIGGLAASFARMSISPVFFGNIGFIIFHKTRRIALKQIVLCILLGGKHLQQEYI